MIYKRIFVDNIFKRTRAYNSISPQYSQPFMSLAAPKANQYSMLQIKTLSQKYLSTIAIFFILLLLFPNNY